MHAKRATTLAVLYSNVLHTMDASIPLVDLTSYLNGGSPSSDAALLKSSLERYGAVLLRDPRVSTNDSDEFIDLMERYFAQPRAVKLQDARPQYFYQVGATPDFTERPRDNSAIAAQLDAQHRPVSDAGARKRDPKWRFFWRLGRIPPHTKFPQLNAPSVIPENFSGEWAGKMNYWGGKLLAAAQSTAELLAIGLGLPKDALTRRMQYGAHLLAPTGSDLRMYGEAVGTVIAGYHYDISALTVHGRSRYPGLHIWTRDGVRLPVVMPEGSLLVQSGLQIECLTAGRVLKGMHEVVVSEETAVAARKAMERGKPVWRVSSTLFCHVSSDESLKPLISNGGRENQYANVMAGEQVAKELKDIELASF